jgi:hypothetical protein
MVNFLTEMDKHNMLITSKRQSHLPTQAAMSRGIQAAARAGVRVPLPPREDGERRS